MNRLKMNRVLSPVLAVLFCLSPYCLAAHAPSAKSLYQQGQLAEEKGDIMTAYEDYAKAFQMSPKDLRYRTSRDRVRYPAASAVVTRGARRKAQQPGR
jgi:hypothetical protein